MKAIGIAAVLIAGLGMAGEAAAAPERQASALLESVTEDDLRALVTAAGDKVDMVHPVDAPSVRGITAKSLRYLLIGVDCGKGSTAACQGLIMQVRYSANDKVTLKGVNDANFNEAAVATWWDAERAVVGFTRYVHLEGGVTWGNLRSNISLLLSAHPAAQALVATSP